MHQVNRQLFFCLFSHVQEDAKEILMEGAVDNLLTVPEGVMVVEETIGGEISVTDLTGATTEDLSPFHAETEIQYSSDVTLCLLFALSALILCDERDISGHLSHFFIAFTGAEFFCQTILHVSVPLFHREYLKIFQYKIFSFSLTFYV